MAKAVFTTKVAPSYKDLPEERYHFPRTYLNFVEQTIGDYIVYYEPRRSTQNFLVAEVANPILALRALTR
jgi:putative restriction endonuclease